jgi:tetratricopeptide (TPR) repeat protein
MRSKRRVADDEFDRAASLQAAGDLQGASDICTEILRRDPSHAGSHYLLGLIAHALGAGEAAIELLGQAHALDRGQATYVYALGIALLAAGREEIARLCFQNAVILEPGFAAAHNNLGVVLAERAPTPAMESFRRAISIDADMVDAHYNLAKALRKAGRLDESIAHYRIAVTLQPGLAAAHNNLGIALAQQNRIDDAIAAYRAALVADPDCADAHYNLGTALLTVGDFAAGFTEYEWRWRTPQLRDQMRAVAAPLWRGEAGDGRTLLIHAEQGLGDSLQFCRLVPMAAARGWRVVLQMQAPLVRLLSGLADEVIDLAAPAPLCAAHVPLLSLPHRLGLTPQSVPGTPYLYADGAMWAAALPPGLHVGLVWAGNPRREAPDFAAVDARRSIDPALLAPLADIAGVALVSLQKTGPAAPFGLFDVMERMADFADTAALVAALDLVITVDTAVAHLAGALGRPVWLLNRFDTCWRWGLNRRDNLWYPHMTIYRQPVPGDWAAVIGEVVADLAALVT